MTAEKNIAVVCNSRAGAGQAILLSQKITAALQEQQILHTLFQDQWPGRFDDFTDIFIVGGDGTLNYFFNHYPQIRLPLVIFKGGTGNDVHALLYGEKTFNEQMSIALTATPRPIDAARCNDKYFINGVGIGFEGAVAKSLMGKKKRPGKAGFMGAILRNLFFYTSKRYHLITEKLSVESDCLLISIMNGNRAGGGFHIAPSSAIDDGWLDVVMVAKLHPFLRLRWLPVIEKGEHLSLPFIRHFHTQKIVVTCKQPVQAHLDGEYYEANRLEIELIPHQYLFRY